MPAEAAEEEPEDEERDPQVLVWKILEAYPGDTELQQIIKAKKTGERKILAPLRENINLELGDCKVVKNPKTRAKHLLEMHVPKNKNDTPVRRL